jgi:hypothetical protein
MDPKDPYRAAKLLIDLHGEGARMHAAQRVFERRMIEDEAGAWTWMQVLDAIVELEAERPADGETLH